VRRLIISVTELSFGHAGAFRPCAARRHPHAPSVIDVASRLMQE
jgi:hypothetical protein